MSTFIICFFFYSVSGGEKISQNCKEGKLKSLCDYFLWFSPSHSQELYGEEDDILITAAERWVHAVLFWRNFFTLSALVFNLKQILCLVDTHDYYSLFSEAYGSFKAGIFSLIRMFFYLWPPAFPLFTRRSLPERCTNLKVYSTGHSSFLQTM